MWYSVFLQKILKNWLKVKWIISLHGNYRGIYFAVKSIQCSVYELSYPFLLPSLQDLKLSVPLHSICCKDLHWTFLFFFLEFFLFQLAFSLVFQFLIKLYQIILYYNLNILNCFSHFIQLFVFYKVFIEVLMHSLFEIIDPSHDFYFEVLLLCFIWISFLENIKVLVFGEGILSCLFFFVFLCLYICI